MSLMRLVEAQSESGLLKPTTPLALRPGECVHLIVVRQPDPKRKDRARLAKLDPADDVALTLQGLENWAANLEVED